jgi:hypothetical protein
MFVSGNYRLPCWRAHVIMSAKISGRHRERCLGQLHRNFNHIGVRTFILYGAPYKLCTYRLPPFENAELKRLSTGSVIGRALPGAQRFGRSASGFAPRRR